MPRAALNVRCRWCGLSAGRGGQPLQRERLFEPLLDEAGTRCAAAGAPGSADGPGGRLAAQAGAVAGVFGRLGQHEEADAVAPRAARGAGGPAVDAGGADGVDERAVLAAVAVEHGAPAAASSAGGRGWVRVARSALPAILPPLPHPRHPAPAAPGSSSAFCGQSGEWAPWAPDWLPARGRALCWSRRGRGPARPPPRRPALDYGRGCPACCLGPFPINRLDALRLQRGLAALAERERRPRRRSCSAGAGRGPRAGADFPGDGVSGAMVGRGPARRLLRALHGARPCPALELRSGRRRLYAHRPSPAARSARRSIWAGATSRRAGPASAAARTRTPAAWRPTPPASRTPSSTGWKRGKGIRARRSSPTPSHGRCFSLAMGFSLRPENLSSTRTWLTCSEVWTHRAGETGGSGGGARAGDEALPPAAEHRPASPPSCRRPGGAWSAYVKLGQLLGVAGRLVLPPAAPWRRWPA